MRTIKFRGQKPSDGAWVYGSLVYSGQLHPPKGGCLSKG